MVKLLTCILDSRLGNRLFSLGFRGFPQVFLPDIEIHKKVTEHISINNAPSVPLNLNYILIVL
jgi:hypothetical protein